MAAPAFPQYRRNRSLQSPDPNDPNSPDYQGGQFGATDPSGNPYPPGQGGNPPTDPRQFAPGATYTNTPNPVPYNPDERDVYNMWQQERNLAQGQGDVLQQQIGDKNNYNRSMEEGYNRQIPGLYQDIWGGGGGYTPEEAAGIKGQAGLDALAWDPNAAASNYLSGTEQARMEGDPMGGFNYFQNRASTLSDFDLNQQGRQRNAVDAMKGDLNTVNQTTADISRARVGNMQQGLEDAANNPNLQMSGEYARQAGMSDQEVNDAASLGGQTAGAVYQRALDEGEAGLHQAGADNPLAANAMRRDLAARQGKDTAMATVDARLRARQAQRDAATGVENTRLSTTRDVATRLGQAAEDVGNLGVGVENQIGGRGVGSATALGGLSSQTERDIANRGVGVQQYIDTTGAGLYNQADQTQAGRARDIATNRQAVNQANQENQFNRGYTLNKEGSQRATTVANQHQQQQAEGRAAAIGQQGYYGSQYNQGVGNQLRAADLTTRARQGAVGGYAGWGNEQDQYGFGSNFSRGFGGGLGSGLGRTLSGGNSSGGHADGGDMDEGQDSMLVLNPEEQFTLPNSTTILPLNPNRETSPDGSPNPYYRMGRNLRPLFRNLAYGQGGHPYVEHPGQESTPDHEPDNDQDDKMNPSYANGGWMSNLHVKKGALHDQLGIPQDQPIPTSRLEQAKNSDNPLERKRANLALTFRHANHSGSHADGGMLGCYADGGRFDPDGDGDDDSSYATDTDHDFHPSPSYADGGMASCADGGMPGPMGYQMGRQPPPMGDMGRGAQMQPYRGAGPTLYGPPPPGGTTVGPRAAYPAPLGPRDPQMNPQMGWGGRPMPRPMAPMYRQPSGPQGYGPGGGMGMGGGFQARLVTQPSTIYRQGPGGPRLQSMTEEGPEIALSRNRPMPMGGPRPMTDPARQRPVY